MTTYIALLRGINVSGHRLIKMTELKAVCEGLGLERVQTYIQSGNLLFRSAEEALVLRRRIEAAIASTFGFEVPVVVKSASEWEQIIRDCPFPHDLPEGESLHLSLLVDTPSQEGVDRLLAFPSGIDEFRLAGQAIYIRYRQSSHKSRLSNNLFEQKLGVAATTRNWQTICKLGALAKIGAY